MWLIQSSRRRQLSLGLVLLIFLSLLAVYGILRYKAWLKSAEDSIAAMGWEGFGPERGSYNFTVVTAMLDIGRGSWDEQSRPYNTYLLYMQQMLRLDVNMAVFVDRKGKPFIDWMRRGRERRTHVVVTDLMTLPYYRYRDRMWEIMNSAEYKQDNELVDRQLCESYVPEYDILQLSKLYFMNRVISENPFHTPYFIWLDGGYGHGLDIYPRDGIWIPKGLFEHSHQVTFIERSPGVKAFKSDLDRLHKMSINIVPGGFFGGGMDALRALYLMQQQQVDEWMKDGVVDDDQTMYMLLYYKKPSLFNLVPADWHDAFKLFNAHEPGR